MSRASAVHQGGSIWCTWDIGHSAVVTQYTRPQHMERWWSEHQCMRTRVVRCMGDTIGSFYTNPLNVLKNRCSIRPVTRNTIRGSLAPPFTIVAPKALIFGWANFSNVCLCVCLCVCLSGASFSTVCEYRMDFGVPKFQTFVIGNACHLRKHLNVGGVTLHLNACHPRGL